MTYSKVKKSHCWWPAFDQKHVLRAGMLTVNQTMTMGNHSWLDSMSKGYATVHSKITSEECIPSLQVLKDMSDY